MGMTEREDAISRIERVIQRTNNSSITVTIPKYTAKLVVALLKEQEEIEGRWIVLEYCANEGIYCSKCMNKIFDRSTKPKKKLSNYCPNCGSKNTHFFNPSTEKIMYSD